MNLRCKPGDLAVIVSAHFPENLGLPVRVLSLAAAGDIADGVCFMPKPEVGPAWLVESSGVKKLLSGGQVVVVRMAFMCDAYLRPIRDPGDDAVDEVLLLVGSPTKETA